MTIADDSAMDRVVAKLAPLRYGEDMSGTFERDPDGCWLHYDEVIEALAAMAQEADASGGAA